MSRTETTESITISFDISLYDTTPEENDQALLSQQTQKYVISKKEVYTAVLEYLESSECIDEYLDNLIKNDLKLTEQTMIQLSKSLTTNKRPKSPDYVINIKGNIAHAQNRNGGILWQKK